MNVEQLPVTDDAQIKPEISFLWIKPISETVNSCEIFNLQGGKTTKIQRNVFVASYGDKYYYASQSA